MSGWAYIHWTDDGSNSFPFPSREAAQRWLDESDYRDVGEVREVPYATKREEVGE